MPTIRNRTKQHLPTVLLTLLSIIQALALELLWTHITESHYLFEPSWLVAMYWTQILASFLGIVLIWIVYASSAMRFRWVPRTSDSVFPFLVGILQFSLVEALGPDNFGYWLINLSLLFGLMTLVDHSIMRRARRDSENDIYFRQFRPATVHDFYPSIAIFIGLAIAGVYLWFSKDSVVVAAFALLVTNGLIVWLLLKSATYWDRSVSDEGLENR